MGGRLQAETNEQVGQANSSINAGAGPHLVVGYRQSAWNANVALVQSTRWQLDRMNQTRADCDNGLYSESEIPADAGLPDVAVDADFLGAAADRRHQSLSAR